MFEYNASNWGDLDDSDEFQSNNEASMGNFTNSPNSPNSQELPEVTVEEEKEFREQFDKLIPTRGCISTGQKSLSTTNLSSNPIISSKTLLLEKSDRWTRNAKILRSSYTTDMNKNAYKRKRRPKHGKDNKDQNIKVSQEDSIEKPKSLIGKLIMENSSWADVVRSSN
jgi:hypothetical protein